MFLVLLYRFRRLRYFSMAELAEQACLVHKFSDVADCLRFRHKRVVV